MNKMINFLVVALFSLLLSCQQSATNADATNNSATDTTIATTTTNETPKSLSQSEMIDNENNKLIADAGEEITKATIKKGAIILYRDDAKVHRIFGYETPDINAKRILVVSAFTNDVEENPFGCELGAYYDMEEIEVQYLETAGDFVKAEVTANGNKKIVFFESKWVEA